MCTSALCLCCRRAIGGVRGLEQSFAKITHRSIHSGDCIHGPFCRTCAARMRRSTLACCFGCGGLVDALEVRLPTGLDGDTDHGASASTVSSDAVVGSVSTNALSVGAAVEIHSLEGARELNGCRGCIVTYVKESDRFGVKIVGIVGTKSVKIGNLRRIDGVTQVKLAEERIELTERKSTHAAPCDDLDAMD